MKDSVRALAAEFKQFLSTRQEDDLTPAAFSQAAAHVSEPKAAPTTAESQPHLTIEFARVAKKSAPSTTSSAAAVASQSTPAAVEPVSDLSTSSKESSSMTAAEKQKILDQIAEEIKACRRCPLGSARLNAVPGEGKPNAALMFIGEGPGFDEDHKGRPFIGRAGQLLDKMIAAMGLKREDVFIANIAKCHPMVNPENPQAHGNDRAPNAGEIAVCRKFIERQIAAISPKYVVALGSVAAKALISDTNSLGALRGKFHTLHLDSVELKKPVKIIATYHPAALLRNPNWKKDAWADLQMVMAEMGLKRPQ
ncbi:MAG: uracil-DNA glycosylase [Elusimicrobiaceae bacterium]|nr:uracil-DNA glycosylase [Elusimicrobiaceae bacterium]